MRNLGQLVVDLHSDRCEKAAFPFDVILGRDSPFTVAAHSADVFIETSNFVPGKIPSHLDDSEDAFSFFVCGRGYPPEVVISF